MMSPISLKALASLAAFLSATNAHMMMKEPIPMGKSSLNNSPLDGSGSDYPCKLRGDSTWDESAGVNELEAGGSYPLSFIGSAVHGGGSCQVSLTNDLQPTKDSTWMVIKSIEGGCPANVAGNLPEDPNGSGASTFQYTIPASMPAGKYTIAWTWHNKVGNREMYMNCGRAVIGGAKKKRYMPTPKTTPFKRDSFPNLFVANIGNGCTVTEGSDVQYPSPGSELEQTPGAALKPPQGSCGGSGGSSPGGGSGSGSDSGSGGASSSAAAEQPAPTQTASATGGFGGGASQTGGFGGGRPTVSPGNFATVTQGGSGSGASQTPSAAAPPPPVQTGSSGGSGSGAATGAQSGPCTNEGAWACAADGSSFQRCASGQWSAPMQMSAGMTCTPGISSNFAMKVAGPAKRDLNSHIARRRHASNMS